jgi:hypothetical protein
VSSIREVETRVDDATADDVHAPARPADNYNVAASKPDPPGGKLQMDLFVLGLACDVTRVANFFDHMDPGYDLGWLGHNTHHNLAHANALKEMTEINTRYASAARVPDGRARQIPDMGGGSMSTTPLICKGTGSTTVALINPAAPPFPQAAPVVPEDGPLYQLRTPPQSNERCFRNNADR